MTPDKFRALALEIPGAVEAAHMNHPDFRLGGKIFASLGYPDDRHAMVALPPDEQSALLRKSPQVFALCAGEWGRRGATSVFLAGARVEMIRPALAVAARKVSQGRVRARSRQPVPK